MMCDHGDVFCVDCVCEAPLEKNTLVPYHAVEAALGRKFSEQLELRSKISALEYELEREQAMHKIHMDVYHTDDLETKKRKTIVSDK